MTQPVIGKRTCEQDELLPHQQSASQGGVYAANYGADALSKIGGVTPAIKTKVVMQDAA